jgi:glycosyltransferase involved in cell wall biosynthesis
MQKKFVFFATAWSAVNGGVNSFNLDLCIAIAAVAQPIYVFIEKGLDPPIDARGNLSIHVLPTRFEDFDKKSTAFISSIIGGAKNCVWVGHDTISGGAAIFTKNTLGGRSAVFHHMDYSNYYYLKSNDVSNKIKNQKHLLKTADVVFGVGPRLFQHARHLRASHQETYQIIPGAPSAPARSRSRSAKFDYRIAICGRLHPSEDKVKNLSAAIKAANAVLGRMESHPGSLTLIGASPNEANSLRLVKDSKVAINAIPYISNRSDYFSELADADLILMPSVKEGFGLVAWEAACLGIPVLTSKSSGFFDFLKDKNLSDLAESLEISGVLAIDEMKINESLSRCINDRESHGIRSARLASALSGYTWKAAAERFISLLEGLKKQSVEIDSSHPQPPRSSSRIEKTRTLFLDKDAQTSGFERFEDLLSLTARRRTLLLPKQACTDYSRGQRIKFEYWATYSPQAAHFLFIHHSSNLKQTIKRFGKLLAEQKLEVPRSLFVLRRDNSDPQYIQKIVSDEGIGAFVHDHTLKEYLWQYAIDDKFKVSLGTEPPLNYVDQAITTEGGIVELRTARELILEKLKGKPEYNAHLVLAAGGMGKTWLCRSIASEISASTNDKNLVVLIQAENLRNYLQEVGSAHVQVSSVFDLYELHSQAQKSDRLYDRSTFELAVIAGNIILIIDGLDELSTLLQERFDLNKFLASIVSLSSSLSSSQILITTRDSLLIDAVASIEFGIAQYELLGFNSLDWTRYARRRFSGHSNSIEIVAKLNAILSSSNLKSVDGRVVPFFVDVLCTMLEDDATENINQDFEFTEAATPYPSNNEITDHIVHSVFRREILRQTIDLDTTQLISLVSELVSEQGDNFGLSALKHLLDLYYETRAESLLHKISLNPFFQVNQKQIRLRYDFLQSYFRSLFLIECLAGTAHSPEALNAYAKSNAAESPEVAYLKKYFEKRHDVLDAQLFSLVPKLRECLKQSEESKRLELVRRSISGALKIYLEARQFSGARISDKILELLPGHLAGQSIDGLAVYGEFPALDFSGKTIFNSKFLDYKNFSKSKFSGSKFISCIFESCATDSIIGSSLHQAEFDPSCTLGDVSIIVNAAKSNHSLEAQTIEAECHAFLRAFFKSGASYDPKKSWLHFSSKVPGLRAKSFEKLIPEFLSIKTEKANETYYTLTGNFVPSARKFIDNNYIDAVMKRFISVVN